MNNPKAPTKRELRSMRWFAHRDTVRRSKKRETQAKGERDRNLAAVTKRCTVKRKRTTKLCQEDRARIREKARAIVAREKKLRADARADYRYEARRSKVAKAPRYTAAEHDSLTEHNIPADFVELWRELKQNFPRTVTPDNRAELFMEWIEEHPNEVTAWRTERYEATPEQYAAAYEAHISEQAGAELAKPPAMTPQAWDAFDEATRLQRRAENAWHNWETGKHKGDRYDAKKRAERADERAAAAWATFEALERGQAEAVPF